MGLIDVSGLDNFDYLKGRVLKVELGKAELDPRLYDRDNGDGVAARAVQALRET